MRLHRWSSGLFVYDLRKVYWPGSENIVTECLSRNHEDSGFQWSIEDNHGTNAENEDETLKQTIFGTLDAAIVSLDQAAAATRAMETLRKLRSYVLH